MVATSKTPFQGRDTVDWHDLVLVPEGAQLCIFKSRVASATRQRNKILFLYFFILDQYNFNIALTFVYRNYVFLTKKLQPSNLNVLVIKMLQ